MSPDPSIPPLRDLPPGRLETHHAHLLSEIEIRQESKPRRRLVSLNPTPLRLAGVAGVAAAIAVTLVSTSGSRKPLTPDAAAPRAPLYSFHVSITSHSRDGRFTPDAFKPSGDHVIPLLDGVSASRERIPRAVLVLAVAQAHAYGNRGPTPVQWVKTTRQKAVSAENAGRVDGGNLRVYFVILHGHFVDNSAPRPPGAKPPRGRILTDTIEIKTGRTLDFGISNGEPNFSKIGTPHHFVIYGHRRSR
jgi:hypothetical protein